MNEDNKITRRDFLKQATGAAVGLAALGGIAPGRVLGANDRINMGVIGCGGQGTHHLRRLVEMSKNPDEKVQVVAVCDIYEPRKQRAKDISGAKLFHDYREMLQLPDLDAVLLGTPDHWHARMTIDAMEAGKDVYCEKPMTLYWDEAKRVAQAADRLGRIVQVGAQGTSDDVAWQANKLIREGAIGKLLWSHTGYCRNSKEGEWNWYIDPDASPKNLDWKAFLGSAPWRPFDKERFFRFRKYWDYSGGIATDLFYHALAHLQIALTPEFPIRVSATGGICEFHDREVPDTFHMLIEYPTNHSVVLTSSMANYNSLGEVIHGHHATLRYEGGNVVVQPQDMFRAEATEQRVPEQPRADHHHNFFDCIRSREQPHCSAQTGYRIMVAIALGVMAYRQQKVVRFDPDKQEVVA
jgi:predicted dehydrogenase